ncbi:MAG: hypothetical protein ACQ9MH_12645 [Nitrospinales bacterium]
MELERGGAPSTQSSLTLKTLIDDIRVSSKGTLFFAHLIDPHDPYVYDSNCQLNKNPISEWTTSEDPISIQGPNSISSRILKYKQYSKQINCLNKKLQILFNAMRSMKIYDKAIIIIHGDHGSRIWRTSLYAGRPNHLETADFMDAYSTLFTVKAEGYKSGYYLETLSLNQAFLKFASKMFK